MAPNSAAPPTSSASRAQTDRAPCSPQHRLQAPPGWYLVDIHTRIGQDTPETTAALSGGAHCPAGTLAQGCHITSTLGYIP